MFIAQTAAGEAEQMILLACNINAPRALLESLHKDSKQGCARAIVIRGNILVVI